MFSSCITVRLEKGDKKSHGVVQVYLHNNWGTVCNDKWSEPDISKFSLISIVLLCVSYK